MSVKITVLIKKEWRVDPRTNAKISDATLILYDESGQEYAHGPRYFANYDEVGTLLRRETGITHEQLQDRYPIYERGEAVRLRITVEDEGVILNLGFGLRSE